MTNPKELVQNRVPIECRIVLAVMLSIIGLMLVFVPIHELGHLLLGYALGLRPNKIILFNFDIFSPNSIVSLIQGNQGYMGWVDWDSTSWNPTASLVENFYYHIFIYTIEIIITIWLNVKLVRWFLVQKMRHQALEDAEEKRK